MYKNKTKEKKEKYFVPNIVKEQLKYGGIIKAIEVKKQGYSISQK